jgi:hypothetical protein
MGRVKRNWTMGIRYSWTLSDDTVWTKTNRLGGRLFIVAGVLAIIGAFLPPLVGIWLLVLPALVMLPITYVYSMNLYKQLHPEAMEPPARPKDLPLMPSDEDEQLHDQVGAAQEVVAHDAVPQEQRVEVQCPSCGADNAPGNAKCIRCGRAL